MSDPQLFAPLSREHTGLLVIDLQQPLLDLMWNREQLVANIRRLAGGARILGLPALVAEQNPDKLGPTSASVADLLEGWPRYPKLAFSCCGDEHALSALQGAGRPSWLVCGIEAHVCVSQTVLDLLARGFRVHVAADAVGSRVQPNWQVGLERMRQAGAVITSTEMALFELLQRAGTDEFRAVQRLVR